MSLSEKQIRKAYKNRTANLLDWGDLDLTGATNLSTQVQAWQDQAATAGVIAEAPAGVIGLAQKVTFKAPTIGAGAGVYGYQSTATLGRSTCFKNLAINDNSWMIDIYSDNADSVEFGLVKGFRCHAGGLNVSLMRVTSQASTPAGFSWAKFLWDDILGYGGYVNFEHYGYGGEIRNVYSKAAYLSAFRAYLCNALRVSGGWFGVRHADGWEFELFRRGPWSTEGMGNIVFDRAVFQSEGFGGVGNGLRIPERAYAIDIRSYFEEHANAIALSVGEYNGCHPSPAIPTPVDVAGADAPTNAENAAARNIVIDTSLMGAYGGWTVDSLFPQYRFGNVRGIHWRGNSCLAGRVIYSDHVHDINGSPTEQTMLRNYSGLNGQNPTATASGGATTINVAATVGMFVGPPVFIEMVAVGGLPEWFETTIASKVLNTSITLTDPIPAGRSVTSSQVITHNRSWFNREYMKEVDPRDRGGPEVSLLPAGNFLGSTGTSMRGVKECTFGYTDGTISVSSDTTVRRNGRPTLKMTRHGAAFPGATYPASVSFYPYGSEHHISGDMNTVAITGWILVPDTIPYNNYVESPLFGLTWTNSVGEVRSPIQVNVAGGGGAAFTIFGKWTYFSYLFELNDTGITKLGVNLWLNGGLASQSYDYSIWWDSLEMFINPRSMQDIKLGRYQRSQACGYFDAAGKFQVDVAATPSSARIRVEQGDRFRNATGTAGQPKAWTVSAAGPASTATFSSEGNL